MKINKNRSLVVALCMMVSMAWADSLELKNGSRINGKFVGGTESEISFQVGSSVQKYSLADVAFIRFDSAATPGDLQPRPASSREAWTEPGTQPPAYVT